MKSYNEFLQSDFWRKLSSQKKQKVGRCEKCGKRNSLQCHHLFYRGDWYETEEGDLQVLCRKCHARLHGKPLHKIHKPKHKKNHNDGLTKQQRRAARWSPGIYEGLTAIQVAQQIGLRATAAENTLP